MGARARRFVKRFTVPANRGAVYGAAMSARTFFAAALAAIVVPAAVPAQGFTVIEDVVSAAVRPGWRTPAGTHMAALEITLAPGWKTYWRSPGDGGIPPLFDWAGSHNLRDVTLHWPRPQVFEQAGLESIGYHDRLVLPIELAPTAPGAAIVLRARVQIGVCRDVCIPYGFAIDTTLAPGGGGNDATIRAALADGPLGPAAGGLRARSCRVEPIADGLRVIAMLDLPATGSPESLVFELPDPDIWISQSEVTRDGARLVATAEMVPPAGAPFALDRSRLRLTVIGRDRAVEIAGCPAG